MNAPKNQRVQELSHAHMPIDSPLRRRSTFNMSASMLPPKTPEIVNSANQTVRNWQKIAGVEFNLVFNYS